MGNAHPSLFPYEPLPTADGDLIITAGNDGQFAKLCEALGLPELADDPRFGRNQDRTANREELRPLLVERLATRTRDGVVPASCSPPASPCGPINTIDERRGVRRGGRPRPRRAARGRRPGDPERPQPDRPSPPPRSVYQLPPPRLDEHGAEMRAWLAEPAAARPNDAEGRQA